MFKKSYGEQECVRSTRKCGLPYDYVSDINMLDETRLVGRRDVQNKLTDSGASDTDGTHAKTVWRALNIQTLGDDLYLKTDVLLLADIFENFQKSCIATFSLHPGNYVTLPSYTFDAMLLYRTSSWSY